MCSLLFAKHYEHDDARLHELLRMLSTTFATSLGIINILPWLRHLPGDLFGVKSKVNKMNEIVEFFKEMIEEHRKTFDENNIRDFTDAFLAEQKHQAHVMDSIFTGNQNFYYGYLFRNTFCMLTCYSFCLYAIYLN